MNIINTYDMYTLELKQIVYLGKVKVISAYVCTYEIHINNEYDALNESQQKPRRHHTPRRKKRGRNKTTSK